MDLHQYWFIIKKNNNTVCVFVDLVTSERGEMPCPNMDMDLL